MNARSMKAETEVKLVPNMIFLQYHDYSDYLLEYITTDNVPTFSYLENPSNKIVVIPRVESFTVHTNVVHYQKYVNKK